MKNRLLVLKDILEKQTNQKNPLTTSALLVCLKREGFNVSRKTLYNDINHLRNSGVEIAKNGNAYYIKEHLFSFAELRILSDLVRSTRFLSTEDKDLFLEKFTRLTNVHDASSLKIGSYVTLPIASIADFHAIILQLQKAIEEQYIIYFHYGSENNTVNVQINPYALYCKNEQYYLMGFCEENHKMKSYLVAYIQNIYISRKKARPTSDFFLSIDPTKKKQEKIKLLCQNKVLYPVLEYFNGAGHIKYGEKSFVFSSQTPVDKELILWLMQFGPNIEVLEPSSLRMQLCHMLLKTAQNYPECFIQ